MNVFQARAFIEQVINAPGMMAAQMMVDSNLGALDATFFQVLQTMIGEAQVQGHFSSNLFGMDLPGPAADYLINQSQQTEQRVQALQILYQYAAGRVQQRAAPSPFASPFGQQPLGPPAQFDWRAAFGEIFTAGDDHDEDDLEDEDDYDFEADDDVEEDDDIGADLGADFGERPAAGPAGGVPSIQALFGVLQQEFEKEKDKGQMDPVRQEGLGDVMESLAKLVGRVGTDRPLEEMTSDRQKLDELMTAMQARIRKPTFEGQSLPAGSRAARVLEHLQELKAYLAGEGMRQRKTEGENEKVPELFRRVATATTRIHETQGAEGKLVALETDQLRALADELRRYARRHHLTLAQPIWSRGNVPLNPNLLFFSGPEAARRSLEPVATRIGLELNPPSRPGSQLSEARWQDLRATGLAVFDLSAATPQVYYELGIALTLGTELLLIAEEGIDPPFNIAQSVHHYPKGQGPGEFLAPELDAALYGLQTRGDEGSSLAASVAFAERLAAAAGSDGLLRVAVESLRKVASDPVQVPASLRQLNSFLGEEARLLLHPRWPGSYPDPTRPRCFVVMPFRERLDAVYRTIANRCEQAGIHPVRGDVARGQEIISSIWQEIGQATHVVVDLTGFNPNVCLELGIAHTLGRHTLLIGEEGTDVRLAGSFPGIAKRRCHTYPVEAPAGKPKFVVALTEFLASPTSAV